MTNQEIIGEVLETMRQAETAPKMAEGKSTGSFKMLPDGEYTGQVYIRVNTVGGEDSPNYGLKKYQFEYTVTEGDQKGKMAYFNCVILPHNLTTKPPETDPVKFSQWQTAAVNSIEKSNKFLQKCGVETSELNFELICRRIAENNRRKTIVNFTIKTGTPHINFIVSSNVEDMNDSLFHDPGIPNGNDAPLV